MKIVVPSRRSHLRDVVWKGAGIVASEHGNTDRLRIDFEGDSEIYPRFADRVRRAADRHCWEGEHRSGFPTRASAFTDYDEVVVIGSFDPESGQLTIEDTDRLAGWLGLDDLPDSELELSRD